MARHLILLFLILLMAGQVTAVVAEPVRITNLKSRYTDLQIEPVLTNDGGLPIFLPTSDGGVLVELFYFDQLKRSWLHWPALGRCGNEQRGFRKVGPGEKESLGLFWGIQAQIFDVHPPPRTEFKVRVSYTLAPQDPAGENKIYVVESTPFRLEYSKHRKK